MLKLTNEGASCPLCGAILEEKKSWGYISPWIDIKICGHLFTEFGCLGCDFSVTKMISISYDDARERGFEVFG